MSGRKMVKKVISRKKPSKPPIGAVEKVTAETVLNENLANALKSGRYLVVVAHVADSRVWHSQTSKGFPLADLPKVFEFVNRELSVGARA